MNTKTEKYKTELLKIIETQKIAFFDHAFAFTSFSRATAYIHNLDKVDDIRDAISQNRVKAKNYMLNKWIASDNPTLQISAFRLLSNSDEHKKLNQSYIDHSSDGNKITGFTLEIVKNENTSKDD